LLLQPQLLHLFVGVILTKRVLTVDAGTEKMQEIAKAIQDGAMAYIMRQFKTIAVIVVPVGAIVFFTSKAIEKISKV
jgi:K(+)-stimulated pyrophosphate-energized sodium pump